MRIENTARSADWVKLSYENQRPNPTLFRFWYDPAWQYRINVVVHGAMVSGTQNNFPVYINLADLGSNFFAHVKPDGSDIVVTGGKRNKKLSGELVSIHPSSNRVI